MITIRMKVVVNGKDLPVFKEGLGAGVLAIQDVTFNTDNVESPMFAMQVIDMSDTFLKSVVRVDIEEVEDV